MTLLELQKVLGDRIEVTLKEDLTPEEREIENEQSMIITGLAKQMINNGRGLNCGELEVMNPKLAVEIIEKWSQEHPRKTMLQDFLEKYPKARLEKNGTPKDVCPESLGYCEEIYCHTNKGDCLACWNRPLEE